MFSNRKKDFKTHQGDIGAKGYWMILGIRFVSWYHHVHPVKVRKLFSIIYSFVYKLNQLITGIDPLAKLMSDTVLKLTISMGLTAVIRCRNTDYGIPI